MFVLEPSRSSRDSPIRISAPIQLHVPASHYLKAPIHIRTGLSLSRLSVCRLSHSTGERGVDGTPDHSARCALPARVEPRPHGSSHTRWRLSTVDSRVKLLRRPGDIPALFSLGADDKWRDARLFDAKDRAHARRLEDGRQQVLYVSPVRRPVHRIVHEKTNQRPVCVAAVVEDVNGLRAATASAAAAELPPEDIDGS